MKLLNSQMISKTCRTFISNFTKLYDKYGRYEQKFIRAHKKNKGSLRIF